MVDSVHEGQQTSSTSDSDEVEKPSKGIVAATIILVCVSMFIGAFFGYVSEQLSIIQRSFCGGMSAGFSLFMGMVIWEIHRQNNLKKTQEAVDEITEHIHRKSLNVLHRQSEAYENMIQSAMQVVSMRVATRMVGEMIPGLANEEQRDAALDQAGDIVIEEIQIVLGAVAEKTGDLKINLCQSESSKG